MTERRKEEEAHNEFMLETEWNDEFGGSRRAAMNGITVEVLYSGNDYYQPRANRDCDYRRWDGPDELRKCNTLRQAKEYSWTVFKSLILNPPPLPEPPLYVDFH